MEDKSFANGYSLQATLPSPHIAEKLPMMPSKKMLKKWRLISLLSMTLDEAQNTLQRLELYRTQPGNNKIEWLNEAIKSLNKMISKLKTESVLDALLGADSANSLMVIAKELIDVRKERRENIENELTAFGAITKH